MKDQREDWEMFQLTESQSLLNQCAILDKILDQKEKIDKTLLKQLPKLD